jgi:hypothetical protein
MRQALMYLSFQSDLDGFMTAKAPFSLSNFGRRRRRYNHAGLCRGAAAKTSSSSFMSNIKP